MGSGTDYGRGRVVEPPGSSPPPGCLAPTPGKVTGRWRGWEGAGGWGGGGGVEGAPHCKDTGWGSGPWQWYYMSGGGMVGRGGTFIHLFVHLFIYFCIIYNLFTFFIFIYFIYLFIYLFIYFFFFKFWEGGTLSLKTKYGYT